MQSFCHHDCIWCLKLIYKISSSNQKQLHIEIHSAKLSGLIEFGEKNTLDFLSEKQVFLHIKCKLRFFWGQPASKIAEDLSHRSDYVYLEERRDLFCISFHLGENNMHSLHNFTIRSNADVQLLNMNSGTHLYTLFQYL